MLTLSLEADMKISLVEQMVARYPIGMEQFRMYRIEYGGHAEQCLCEGVIWLPRLLNPSIIEDLLESYSP